MARLAAVAAGGAALQLPDAMPGAAAAVTLVAAILDLWLLLRLRLLLWLQSLCPSWQPAALTIFLEIVVCLNAHLL